MTTWTPMLRNMKKVEWPPPTNLNNVRSNMKNMINVACMFDLLEEEPNNNWHHSVVYHMETGHLILLVPHHHEEGVHEVRKLREEVPPDSTGHNVSILRVRVVNRLADPAVLSCQPEARKPSEDPQTHQSLEEIVCKHQLLDIIGWPVLHESRTSKADHVVVESAEKKGWPWGRHQEPVVNPGVEGKDLNGNLLGHKVYVYDQ
jgi:hypothetical protein